jgi:hypothetical protein
LLQVDPTTPPDTGHTETVLLLLLETYANEGLIDAPPGADNTVGIDFAQGEPIEPSEFNGQEATELSIKFVM